MSNNEGTLRIKGDTASAVSAVNNLTSAQQKFTSEVAKSQTVFEKLQGVGASIAAAVVPLNQGLELAGKAVAALKAGLEMAKEVAELHKLQKAVPVETFKALDVATGELYKRTDLLRFASKALAGDLKLTESQMADVLNASRALADQGYGTMTENAEKLLKAVQKGGAGLDDFGLIIKSTGDKTRDAVAVLEKLHGIAADAGPVDEETARIAKMNRAFEDLHYIFAELIAPIVMAIAAGVRALVDNIEEIAPFLPGGAAAVKIIEIKRAQAEERRQAREALENSPYQDDSVIHGILRPTIERPEELYRERKKRSGRGGGKASPQVIYGGNLDPSYLINNSPFASKVPGTGFGDYAMDSEALDRLEAEQNGVLYQAGNYDRGVMDGGSLMGGAALDDKNSPAAKAAAFMAQLSDQANISAGAFGVFQDAFGAAVSATVDGSESMAKAFARVGAAGLQTLAVDYGVRAIGEGAWALASLAVDDPKGAALHGAAALKFGLAAAAAGAGSHALSSVSSSGAGASASPGGGYASATGGSSSSRAGDSITINIGDGFIGNDQDIAGAVSRAIREAKRSGKSRDGYTTSFSG